MNTKCKNCGFSFDKSYGICPRCGKPIKESGRGNNGSQTNSDLPTVRSTPAQQEVISRASGNGSRLMLAINIVAVAILVFTSVFLMWDKLGINDVFKKNNDDEALIDYVMMKDEDGKQHKCYTLAEAVFCAAEGDDIKFDGRGSADKPYGTILSVDDSSNMTVSLGKLEVYIMDYKYCMFSNVRDELAQYGINCKCNPYFDSTDLYSYLPEGAIVDQDKECGATLESGDTITFDVYFRNEKDVPEDFLERTDDQQKQQTKSGKKQVSSVSGGNAVASTPTEAKPVDESEAITPSASPSPSAETDPPKDEDENTASSDKPTDTPSDKPTASEPTGNDTNPSENESGNTSVESDTEHDETGNTGGESGDAGEPDDDSIMESFLDITVPALCKTASIAAPDTVTYAMDDVDLSGEMHGKSLDDIIDIAKSKKCIVYIQSFKLGEGKVSVEKDKDGNYALTVTCDTIAMPILAGQPIDSAVQTLIEDYGVSEESIMKLKYFDPSGLGIERTIISNPIFGEMIDSSKEITLYY